MLCYVCSMPRALDNKIKCMQKCKKLWSQRVHVQSIHKIKRKKKYENANECGAAKANDRSDRRSVTHTERERERGACWALSHAESRSTGYLIDCLCTRNIFRVVVLLVPAGQQMVETKKKQKIIIEMKYPNRRWRQMHTINKFAFGCCTVFFLIASFEYNMSLH